ncbi:MAG: alpha-2-macroglobulin [Thermoanaerobaculia bacterium]|nr:alpha-2-macroglobulin [Thermoanaerobaculia bacterium]
MNLIAIVFATLSFLPIPGNVFFATATPAGSADYATLRRQAETAYAEHSYARAHEIYARAKREALQPDEQRWLRFRLADTAWRAEASDPKSDDTDVAAARDELLALLREAGGDHDKLWAEVNESLGDLSISRVSSGVLSPMTYYEAALDWWAGSGDIEHARARYLSIVRGIASGDDDYLQGVAQQISAGIFENAAKIATTPADRQTFHYVLAMRLNNTGDQDRVGEELEAAIREGNVSKRYDNALIMYGRWLERQGRVIILEDGRAQRRPDYTKALAVYRRILAEFANGESRFRDEARNAAERITNPTVSVQVSNVFLPDSEVEFNLSWRNVKSIDLTLSSIDLTRDPHLDSSSAWLASITPSPSARVRNWKRDTEDKGDYEPGSARVRIDPKLPAGAYLLQANGGANFERALVLITDATVVLRTDEAKSVIYACSAITGAPIANARVKVWERHNDNNGHDVARAFDATTNADGLAEVALDSAQYMNLFVAIAQDKGRQAFAETWKGTRYSAHGEWKIYAYTDRPAYRPEETVKWKFTARRFDELVPTNPAGATLQYTITDPRGTKVAEGSAKLNAFGSAWGTLPLTPTMPLGVYQINFRNGTDDIGNAQLFRLEEYKLPEFKVEVHTPEENGHKKLFRLGDTIEATIDASYYYGGPVANAKVEAVVYSRPYTRWWWRPRDYAWYYTDSVEPNYYGGNGQIIKREELTTDANGHAVVHLPTQRDGSEVQYTIEARVTDASRREITGTGSVRVTRQRYSVHADPEHYVYRPNQKATIRFKAIDANDNPVRASGTVTITRDWWEESWIDPQGHEVRGAELDHVRASMRIFPPRPHDPCGWQLKSRGYKHEDVLTTKAETDANGDAEVTFTPSRDGYYRVSWSSPDRDPSNPNAPLALRDVVTTETTVWVVSHDVMDIGYRHDGVEIIVDKSAFKVGQTAPVMIVTPSSNRWVLFSIDAESILDYKLVHVDGTVKLIELPIEEKHVPNVFLNAASVADLQLSVDQKEIVVPPLKNAVDISVKSDREQYQPREEGTLTVTTRDADGKPLSAEVGLGLVDDSVYSIQTDFAGDPRQFFFGDKRSASVQTIASVQQRPYAKFVLDDGKVVNEREVQALDELKKERDDKDSVEGGVEGVVGGVLGGAVAESITVTAAAAPQAMAMKSAANMAPPPAAPPPPPGQPAGAEPAVQVRSDFRSTIFWQPDVKTDANGVATIKITYPDSLTTWRATARAVTAANQFGMATSTSRTKMPLIVRLQAPRFFVVGDRVTISAVINNNTDAPMRVTPSLYHGGLTQIEPPPSPMRSHQDDPPIDVPANGEKRVDWVLTVPEAGTASLQVSARGEKFSDAMTKTFPIYEHGIDKLIAKSGRMRGDDAIIKLDLPAARRSTEVVVQVTPSLAVTMLDALPYLIDYPYGCTEQTMSRFLPAAIVARTLRGIGADPADIAGRMFGGIEASTASATHPKGKHDLAELDRITDAGMKRLYDFQHDDGGWGWWKEGSSDPWMTAYVIWGFAVARDAGLPIHAQAVDRAANWLDTKLVNYETNREEQSWLLHALGAWRRPPGTAGVPPALSSKPAVPNKLETKALDNIWEHREKLTAYARALFALAEHDFGNAERANVLIRNLGNGVRIDRAPDSSVLIQGANGRTAGSAETMATAHWGETGFWWRWSDGPVESTSFALMALVAIDPSNKLIEPATNWLIKNRRGAQWNNTRDTAITILALDDYVHASGELTSEATYEISVNGVAIATQTVKPSEILRAPSRWTIPAASIRENNEINVHKTTGKGTLYFAAEARFFSLEEPIKAAGNEIFVRRDYYHLVGHPTLLKGQVYDKVPLRDGETLNSGERVEVVVTVETKNDYEYLLFEDLKPAGLEAVEIRSGEPLYATELKSGTVTRKFVDAKRPATEKPSVIQRDPNADTTGRTEWLYQELRDRKVAIFASQLPQGIWEIRYTLRAEVPGSFHALPLMAQAMYVPEIKANSEEVRINVK